MKSCAKLPAIIIGRNRTVRRRSTSSNARLPALAKGDYSLPAASVDLVVDTVLSFDFDRSDRGQWRQAPGKTSTSFPRSSTHQRVVARAMKEIPAPCLAAEPANAGVSNLDAERHQLPQGAWRRGRLPKRWDLGDLRTTSESPPDGHAPRLGNNYIKDGYLAEYWEQAFKKFQPDVTIEFTCPPPASASPRCRAAWPTSR